MTEPSAEPPPEPVPNVGPGTTPTPPAEPNALPAGGESVIQQAGGSAPQVTVQNLETPALPEPVVTSRGTNIDWFLEAGFAVADLRDTISKGIFADIERLTDNTLAVAETVANSDPNAVMEDKGPDLGIFQFIVDLFFGFFGLLLLLFTDIAAKRELESEAVDESIESTPSESKKGQPNEPVREEGKDQTNTDTSVQDSGPGEAGGGPLMGVADDAKSSSAVFSDFLINVFRVLSYDFLGLQAITNAIRNSAEEDKLEGGEGDLKNSESPADKKQAPEQAKDAKKAEELAAPEGKTETTAGGETAPAAEGGDTETATAGAEGDGEGEAAAAEAEGEAEAGAAESGLDAAPQATNEPQEAPAKPDEDGGAISKVPKKKKPVEAIPTDRLQLEALTDRIVADARSRLQNRIPPTPQTPSAALAHRRR